MKRPIVLNVAKTDYFVMTTSETATVVAARMVQLFACGHILDPRACRCE
jgi:hypothetical protein